jgi:5-bromo-4-chloroindolyl phosphate hydrolysis protein
MISPEFKVHMLNENGKRKAVQIAEGFTTLLAELVATGLTGRELALVKTKLEEACYYAKRGMASLPENQE